MTPNRHGAASIEFPSELEILLTREFDAPIEARRVVATGGGDVVAVETLGDGTDTGAPDVLGEDALEDGSGGSITLKATEPLTMYALLGFGCGPASTSW